MIESMLEETTRLLCRCGSLPALKANDREFEEAENRLSEDLARVFTGVENRVIAEIRRRGYIPSNRSDQITFVRHVMTLLLGEFHETLFAAALSEMNRGRLIAFRELGGNTNGIRLSYQDFDQFVSNRLRDRVYQFSRETFERIIGDISQSLQNSYEKGLGINDAGDELKKEMDELRDWKVRLIARTEINSAQNEGLLNTYQELGAQYKQWLTARDSRVRGNKPGDKANHIVLHGEIVKIGERFSNGLMMPGDRSTGNLAQFINCRCRIRSYIPKPGEMILSTPYRP